MKRLAVKGEMVLNFGLLKPEIPKDKGREKKPKSASKSNIKKTSK